MPNNTNTTKRQTLPDKMPTLQIRLSKGQKERIQNKAQSKGFKTISSYIRHLALEKGLLQEQKFEEIYKTFKKLKHILKSKETGLNPEKKAIHFNHHDDKQQ